MGKEKNIMIPASCIAILVGFSAVIILPGSREIFKETSLPETYVHNGFY